MVLVLLAVVGGVVAAHRWGPVIGVPEAIGAPRPERVITLEKALSLLGATAE